jgi:hypothetical protein
VPSARALVGQIIRAIRRCFETMEAKLAEAKQTSRVTPEHRVTPMSANGMVRPCSCPVSREWHDGLTEDWQEFVTYVLDAWSKWGEDYAKKWAAQLPPAPRGYEAK